MPESGIVDLVLKFIGVVGIPASLAFFVLYRLNGKLQALVDNISELSKNIAVLLDREKRNYWERPAPKE